MCLLTGGWAASSRFIGKTHQESSWFQGGRVENDEGDPRNIRLLATIQARRTLLSPIPEPLAARLAASRNGELGLAIVW